MNIMRGIIILVLFAALDTIASAQGLETRPSQHDCSRIDKTKPPLFITFERTESGKVFLRLHNNARCSVLIPTNQHTAPAEVMKQPNGGLRVEQTEALRDGSQVQVVYHLFNLRGSKNTVIVSDGDVVRTWQLLPQQSIVFTVPLDHFRKHADVGVEFIYPWEDDGGSAPGGAFMHYVFFRNKALVIPR